MKLLNLIWKIYKYQENWHYLTLIPILESGKRSFPSTILSPNLNTEYSGNANGELQVDGGTRGNKFFYLHTNRVLEGIVPDSTFFYRFVLAPRFPMSCGLT